MTIMIELLSLKVYSLALTGYVKEAKDWYQSIMILRYFYVSINVTWDIAFDKKSFSLYCCITGLWHPVNKKYVFSQTMKHTMKYQFRD